MDDRSLDPDYEIIYRAMAEFVTVLCDGAWDTEGESAHLDVIALAYVMPAYLTIGFDEERRRVWGAWANMCSGWRADGRSPAVVPNVVGNEMFFTGPFSDTFNSNSEFAASMVATAIADGFADKLIGPRNYEDIELLDRLAELCDRQAAHHLRQALLVFRDRIHPRCESDECQRLKYGPEPAGCEGVCKLLAGEPVHGQWRHG